MGTAERKWTPRLYRDGDEEGILELWKAVYPDRTYVHDEWLKWWRWLYRDNPAGMAVIAVADHDSRIVAHTCEIPVMMKIGARTVPVGINLNTMTHPDYRRQGTLKAMVPIRRQESEKRGIQATYGFKNKYAYAYPEMAATIGMFDAATIQKVFRPLDWRATLRTQTGNGLVLAAGPAAGAILSAVVFRPGKARCPEGLAITPVTEFDDRVDRLWDRASGPYRSIVRRDRTYLNWRYVTVPDRHYTILAAGRPDAMAGYAAYSCSVLEDTMTGIIVDVFAETREVAECLIAAAAAGCREQKAALVWSARIAGTTLAAAYRRQGFIALPRAKSILINGWTKSPDLAADMQDQRGWFLQMGDSDEA